VLLHFGEGYAKELCEEDFSDEEGAIRVVEDFPIDIFTRMAGYCYEDLLGHVQLHQVEAIEIPYLEAEGLIKLKQGSLREKDQIDVAILRRLV
jgi:hypothetical protein